MTEDHTELFTKNVAVDAYNIDRLAALSAEPHTYQMEGKGEEMMSRSRDARREAWGSCDVCEKQS